MTHPVWNALGMITLGLALATPLGINAAEWAQLGSDIVGEDSLDESGRSVSLSADGSRVAIGAPFNDNDRGHVRVYRFFNDQWVQLGADIDGESEGDLFGTSVSLSADGTRLAVGAPEDHAGGTARGRVRVYEWFLLTSTWLQVGLDIVGADGELLGQSVSLDADGSRVAIGSAIRDYVRVLTWLESYWVQLGLDINGDTSTERFGYSVSLSADGDRVAIGAPKSDANFDESGRVVVFEWFSLTSSWLRFGQKLYGEGASHHAGWSVSLSADGSRLAYGAPYSDGSDGHVSVFDHDGSFWVQRGANIPSEADFDQFGFSVALSADGARVAAGAIFADSTQGHARVHEWSNPHWVQVNETIRGSVNEQWFGYSVSLSADGSHVAIGTVVAPELGNRAGVSRVYYEVLFADGFEDGTTSAWSTEQVPGPQFSGEGTLAAEHKGLGFVSR